MKRRVAIVQTHSATNEELYRLTLPNHAEYAGTHSYDMIQLNSPWEDVRWNIWLWIGDLLKSYDHILSVGSDVIFTDMKKPLSFFVDSQYGVVISLADDGGSPINNELSLWNNNEKAFRVLEYVYGRRESLDHHPWIGQQAMWEFLQTSEGKDFIKTLPCRQLQSAPIQRFSSSAWQKGDFALHFVGWSGVGTLNGDKMMRVKHFLETGKVMWWG